MSKYLRLALFLIPLCVVSCETVKVDNNDEILTRREQKYKNLDTLFSDDAFTFGNAAKSDKKGEIGIGVNSFLWRASLDTISFMPLKSADPFGGVILTDWYTSSETPRERIKVDILILGRQLRADGLKVSIFQQKLDHGQWIDQPAEPATIRELEDIILTRARQLRIKNGK